MAHVDEEFPGRDWTGPSHMTYIDSANYRPWDLRYRWRKSQQTWSGKVTYHRKKHAFTMTDLMRIQRVVQEGEPPESGKVYEFLWKAWTWVYRLLWRPLFEELGIAGITDAIERYTFERAWNYIKEGVVGQITDAITEGLYLINTFNEQLPSQERLHLIKEDEFEEIGFDLERKEAQISSLEDEVRMLQSQLSEVLANG